MEGSNKEILLSIVVPVYKVEQYLEQCVDSLIAQNCSELEVILVDDGSPDRSPEICDVYAEKYANISVIHKENGGLVSARKAGVRQAKGKYISFVDSDDWIAEGYCTRIIDIIKRLSPEIIAVTGHYRVESNKRIIQYKEADRNGLYERVRLETEVFPEILYKSPYYSFGVTPALWLKVIKQEALKQYIEDVPDIVTMGEDLCVSLPVFLSAETVYFANICGYYYRMNPTSITHSYDPRAIVRIATLLDYLKKVTAPYDAFHIRSQLDMYATWIVSGTVTSLILGSSDIRKDLDEMEELLQNEYVIRGAGKKIPIKSKVLLSLARRKNVCLLMLLKKGFILKKKLVKSFWNS